MVRLLLVAALAAAVAGLTIKDDDNDDDKDVVGDVGGEVDEDAPADEEKLEEGMVSALDPELTNSAMEKFHVTQPGEYVMIGMPEYADPSSPETSELMLTATFEKLTAEKCEDVLIRKVVMQGTKLGSNVSKVEFFVANDIFNSTHALGLNVNTMENLTAHSFSMYTGCLIMRPRGYIHIPTKHSYRNRQRLFTAECTFWATDPADTVIVTVHWQTVWRGVTSDGHNIYANDMSFAVSNVGKDSIGLLGTDDHTEQTKAIPGCNKAQPISGPFQTRIGPKHPKKWKGQ